MRCLRLVGSTGAICRETSEHQAPDVLVDNTAKIHKKTIVKNLHERSFKNFGRGWQKPPVQPNNFPCKSTYLILLRLLFLLEEQPEEKATLFN